MTDPFLGEIRRVAFGFPPKGWALCNGQLLSIAQNQALFALLGAAYGGDGRTTFALPNLQGRAPIHPGNGSQIVWGQTGGAASVTLNATQIPPHTHGVRAASEAATTASPSGATWATTSQPAYGGGGVSGVMNPAAVAAAGGNQPHENQPPYLVINHIIALTGIFPSRG